jgi:hypothetical protein
VTQPISLPKIEIVPIEAIRPYHRNARKNDAAVPAVKASIERYGLNQPLVVDGKNVIVVGHTRYRALIELGAKEVPVVRPKLTAAQVREYRIADNKTGEIAQWDKDQLIPELRAMGDAGQIMAPFFVERDLARLLADAAGSGVEQRPVDQERMDRVLDREAQGGSLRRPAVDSQIKLECPHCGDSFFVDRATIETHPGETS